MEKLNSQNAPSETLALPNRVPFFYGWVILAAATVGQIMTSPGQTYAISIFIEHFIRDLGITRTQVSSLYAVGTAVASFALPFVGRKIDVLGPRKMVVIISILLAGACVLLSFALNWWLLLLGFIGVRMFGQGSLMLVSQNVINQWWIKRRGFMLGLSGVFMSLIAMGGFPNLIDWLNLHFDWRTTYLILGAMCLFLMAPVGFLFFRNGPEEYGLKPDGVKSALASGGKPNGTAKEGWLAKDAYKTHVFWIGAFGLAVIAMLVTALFFHIVSIIVENGLPETFAAKIFVPVAATTAVVNLASGVLADRIPVKFVLASSLFCLAIAVGFAPFVTTKLAAIAYGVIIGMTLGFSRTSGGVIWAHYFGRRELGTISGSAQTILIIGTAIGPLPLGIAYDIFGSYNAVLWGLVWLPISLAIAAVFMKREL